MHEVSLGGHVYLQLVKEKLMQSLRTMKAVILAGAREKGEKYKLTPTVMRAAARKGGAGIGDIIKTFVATGSLPKNIRCGLMQNTGDHIALVVIMQWSGAPRGMFSSLVS